MNFLIGGGSGFIGRSLASSLRLAGHKVQVISRKPKDINDVSWNSIKQSGLPKNVDVVVNLSGRSIGEVNASFLIKQNYDRYIQEVFSSRLDTTKLLVDLSKGTPLKAFINASAIGFYAPDLEVTYDESAPFKNCGLITSLVKQCEDAAQIPSRPDIRQIQLRIGIVLAKDSNFIRSLYLSHRMGFCNPIGTGRQWISWIHIHDLIRIIEYITDPESVFSSGPVNCTAPEPVRQVTLAKALSESLGASFNPLSKIPIPPFIFNYLLGKDRATLVVDGQRVVPTKLLNSGFKFTYPNLADAFENIFGHRPCL
ncbi:Epimerase family protein [Schistosoma japonicum]|nr:Epimerase family protein [Schistosoma japonicum]